MLQEQIPTHVILNCPAGRDNHRGIRFFHNERAAARLFEGGALIDRSFAFAYLWTEICGARGWRRRRTPVPGSGQLGQAQVAGGGHGLQPDADKLNRIGSVVTERLPVRFGEELGQAVLHVSARHIGKRQAQFGHLIAILEIDLTLKTNLLRGNAFLSQLGPGLGLKLPVVTQHGLGIKLVHSYGHATDIVVAIIRQE